MNINFIINLHVILINLILNAVHRHKYCEKYLLISILIMLHKIYTQNEK